MASILCHTNVSEVVLKYPPKPVQNLTLKPGKFLVSLTWEDPQDYTEEGYTCTWVKTVVVRKTGGYPKDIHDGTVVVSTVERDKHKSTPYSDTGLNAGTTYYYRVFSCSADGVYGMPAEGYGTPFQYRTMTVKLNLNNSNPAKIGSYADDALGMKSGRTDTAIAMWQEFFQYRPCLFNNGKVVGYLNPTDHTKFENGKDADIESGNNGDVMIEFPRRGLKISKSGKVITISMTDNPSDSNFDYYAHRRGSTDKDSFYLGAYPGSNISGALRSLRDKDILTGWSKENMIGYGKNRGTNYGILSFYQWTYIQCMYLLQFGGNPDSGNMLGLGVCRDYSRAHSTTGGVETPTAGVGGHTGDIALFGITQIYGNLRQIINGVVIHPLSLQSKCKFFTSTDDTSSIDVTDNGCTDYEISGVLGDYDKINSQGYISDIIGTSEGGFLPIGVSGSSSTYFCDYAYSYKLQNLSVGGYYGRTDCGIFELDWISNTDECCTRLQYL